MSPLPPAEEDLWCRYKAEREGLRDPRLERECAVLSCLLMASIARRYLRLALAGGHSSTLVERFQRCVQMETGEGEWTKTTETGGRELPAGEPTN